MQYFLVMFFDSYFILFECSRLFGSSPRILSCLFLLGLFDLFRQIQGMLHKNHNLCQFYEFMEHLCNIMGQNKGHKTHNHSLLLCKACLSWLKANDNNNGTSKQIVVWMGQLINDKAQNTQAARVQSFNSTTRKWQSHEDALASIAAATASSG